MKPPRSVPPPPGPTKPSYGRFIPREEIEEAQVWRPDSLGGMPAAKPPLSAPAPPAPKAPPPPPPPHPRELLAAARQAGYQDGLRDGQASADAFKQNHSRLVAQQLGALVQSFDQAFAELEQRLAEAVTRTAVALAQQVVREELRLHPEHIGRVAHDAVDALLVSAKHVRVRVHPDDLPLVREGAADVLQQRGAHLLPDPSVARGGCLVDSDLASLDAQIATRWAQAAQHMGSHLPWQDSPAPPADVRAAGETGAEELP